MNLSIVGTDTGVGKTIITAAVVGALRERDCDVRAIKPVQTGFPPDDDAEVIATVCDTSEAAVCLRYLEAPLAPAVAADQAGVDLSYTALYREVDDALSETAVGVVEGTGGVRVPLADGREVIDLVSDLGCATVVVARSGLGTLNHTALTLEALARRDVPVIAVVLNEYNGATTAERSNPEVLRSMTDTPVVTMPTVDHGDLITTAQEQLAPIIARLDQRSDGRIVHERER